MALNRFVLLVPVKHGPDAKSRLGYDEPLRAALRWAFVQDTVAAARACPLVTVRVVGDGSAVPDVPTLPDQGAGDLNRALSRAAGMVADPDTGVAALLGDLPALRSLDLAEALSSPAERFFVADAAGTGTTLLAAAPGVALDPAFGVGSACRHAASGAVAVTGSLASLRQDVDTRTDLDAAVALGVGSRTRAVLANR